MTRQQHAQLRQAVVTIRCVLRDLPGDPRARVALLRPVLFDALTAEERALLVDAVVGHGATRQDVPPENLP